MHPWTGWKEAVSTILLICARALPDSKILGMWPPTVVSSNLESTSTGGKSFLACLLDNACEFAYLSRVGFDSIRHPIPFLLFCGYLDFLFCLLAQGVHYWAVWCFRVGICGGNCLPLSSILFISCPVDIFDLSCCGWRWYEFVHFGRWCRSFFNSLFIIDGRYISIITGSSSEER